MLTAIRNIKSENWGGVIGAAGSLIVLAAGDTSGIISSLCFLVSEYIFTRKGHETLGYSLGCAGLSIGDALLCFSHATVANTALQVTMVVMAASWAVGALRYPIEQMGLIRAAAIIPPLVASANLMLRIPALGTAIFTGGHVNMVMLVCNVFWGISDVLLGRVQRFFQQFSRIFSIYRKRV